VIPDARTRGKTRGASRAACGGDSGGFRSLGIAKGWICPNACSGARASLIIRPLREAPTNDPGNMKGCCVQMQFVVAFCDPPRPLVRRAVVFARRAVEKVEIDDFFFSCI